MKRLLKFVTLRPLALNLVTLSAVALLVSACPNGTATTQAGTCSTNVDCADNQVCVNGTCFQSNSDGGVTAACSSDAQCQAIDPSLICNASGLCELPSTGAACTVTTDCPLDQFCNYQSQVCTALQPGYCREDSQCSDQVCSATPGGVGRCVECLSGSDCPSGNCLSNGVCAAADESCDPPCETGFSCSRGSCVPIAGACNPPCLDVEECIQGVCYGENGCPRHAHPVDEQCACDEDYVPTEAGNACIPSGETCDPDAQLACQQSGGTWDAVNCTCLTGGTNDCDPICSTGTVCQNGNCVPVAGSCTSTFDCLLSGGSSFMSCDSNSGTCVCDALQGMIMCLLFADDFDPNTCDCVYYDPPDAGVTYDAALPDTATTPDAATSPDSAGLDAGFADVPVNVDSGSSNVCDPVCSGDTPNCVEGHCVGCTQDSDCASGLCNLADHSCDNVECFYDSHCSSYAPHCSADFTCVTAHDCGDEMAYIPYPWDDSMTVVIEGDTASADSNWNPGGSCGDADGSEDIYSFSLPYVVRRVTVKMEPLPTSTSWDTHLYAADGICGSTNLGCIDQVPSAQPEVLVMSNFYSSDITIVADGYAYSDWGPYRLTLTVDECDSVNDCAQGETCLNAANNNSRCKAQ